MWPPGYHNNAFMGIPELGHSIYGIFYGYSIIVNLLEKTFSLLNLFCFTSLLPHSYQGVLL